MVEAWYDPTNHVVSTDKNDPRFTALGQLWKLVPEQSDQEPAAWVECAVLPWLSIQTKDVHATTRLYRFPNETYDTPIYTAPPKREWVDLTDEDIAELHDEWAQGNLWEGWNYERAIEAKLREKNQ